MPGVECIRDIYPEALPAQGICPVRSTENMRENPDIQEILSLCPLNFNAVRQTTDLPGSLELPGRLP